MFGVVIKVFVILLLHIEIIFMTTFSLQSEFLILGYCLLIYLSNILDLLDRKTEKKREKKYIQLKNCKEK